MAVQRTPVADKTGRTRVESLFQKYGGFAAISRIVLDLYNRLLDDDDVGPFFDNVEMGKIVDHQTKFVAAMLGGPASYTDDQIGRLHQHLAISDAAFDRFREILEETLNDHGLSPGDVATILGQFEQRRQLVVEQKRVDRGD